MMCYPKIAQPTHARWEQIQVSVLDTTKRMSNGMAELTNGVQDVRLESIEGDENKGDSIFTPVPPIVSRNYLVVDTYFASPPVSSLGVPGPDGDFYDAGTNGLPDIENDMLDELPPECRRAIEDARKKEQEWKNQWRTESLDGARTKIKIGFSGVPV